MKQQTIIATITLCALAILLAFTSSATHATGGEFTVTLDISNVAPEINWVYGSIVITPVANNTINTSIYFNATDENGANDLNDSTAQVIVELGSEQLTSTGCSVDEQSTNEKAYNCTVQVPYYLAHSSDWQINASIQDNQAVQATNTTQTLTINELRAITLSHAALSYAGTPGTSDIPAQEGAQVIYNLGNYDFQELNLTGYNLVGNSTAEVIEAGNFSINTTASAQGQLLINGQPVPIQGFDLTPEENASETLYAYLSIPSDVAPDTYNSAENWVLDAE